MSIPTCLRRMRHLALVLPLGLAPWSILHADELLNQAQALVQQGDAQRAFALLDAQEGARAGDPAFDEAMGRAAHAARQYTRAVMAWERVVAARPDDVAAQVELARALHAVGDRRGVQALSDQARARGIPVDAALSIDQFLVSYDRPDHGGRSTINGYVELGGGRDSNANAGPGTAQLASPVPGTPLWTLAPSALATKADFAMAALSVRGRYVLDPRWSLVGSATLAGRRHGGDAGAFDSSQFDAAAGVSWRSERHEFIVSGQGSYYALDGERLRTLGGVLGEWIYRIDGYRQWGSFLQVLDMDYPTQHVRDVRRTVAGTTYSQVFRNGSIAYAGLYGGREAPRADNAQQWGHRLVGLRIGGQVPVNNQWAVFAGVDWEHRRYGAEDPFFALVRRDRQTNVALGLSWVPSPGWRITPQWTLTRNDSSLPVTDYDRRVVSVTVRREF